MCNCDHNQVSEYSMLIFIEYISELYDIALKTDLKRTYRILCQFYTYSRNQETVFTSNTKIELPDEVNIF